MLQCVLASVSLVLPPLPDASAFDKGSAAALKEFSATTASNWVIPGRLKVGIGISDGEGCAMVAAPSDPTLKELSAVGELIVREVRLLHGVVQAGTPEAERAFAEHRQRVRARLGALLGL